MRRARVAVVGLGKLGLRCAQVVLASDDLLLAAIVRRPESAGKRVPDSLGKPAVASLGELSGVDAALVCVPPARTREVASTVLRSGIPIVECARLHRDRFREHKAAIHRVALHAGTSAVVGAGWDPGVLSLFRGLLALVAPHGQTVLVPRSGAALHPTTLAENVAGVERAVATERASPDGRTQRYVYVELARGADPLSVERAIRGDPLFLDGETYVFPVESVAELESETSGVTLERRTSAGDGAHPHLFLEARFDEHQVAAEVMVATVRALPSLARGAASLFDEPLRALFPAGFADREWI